MGKRCGWLVINLKKFTLALPGFLFSFKAHLKQAISAFKIGVDAFYVVELSLIKHVQSRFGSCLFDPEFPQLAMVPDVHFTFRLRYWISCGKNKLAVR